MAVPAPNPTGIKPRCRAEGGGVFWGPALVPCIENSEIWDGMVGIAPIPMGLKSLPAASPF